MAIVSAFVPGPSTSITSLPRVLHPQPAVWEAEGAPARLWSQAVLRRHDTLRSHPLHPGSCPQNSVTCSSHFRKNKDSKQTNLCALTTHTWSPLLTAPPAELNF